MGKIYKGGIVYGHTDSDNSITLTQSQYDSLSAEEKNNGTQYFISDKHIIYKNGIEYGDNDHLQPATRSNQAVEYDQFVNALNSKQNTLTAGANISIVNNVISSRGGSGGEWATYTGRSQTTNMGYPIMKYQDEECENMYNVVIGTTWQEYSDSCWPIHDVNDMTDEEKQRTILINANHIDGGSYDTHANLIVGTSSTIDASCASLSIGIRNTITNSTDCFVTGHNNEANGNGLGSESRNQGSIIAGDHNELIDSHSCFIMGAYNSLKQSYSSAVIGSRNYDLYFSDPTLLVGYNNNNVTVDTDGGGIIVGEMQNQTILGKHFLFVGNNRNSTQTRSYLNNTIICGNNPFDNVAETIFGSECSSDINGWIGVGQYHAYPAMTGGTIGSHLFGGNKAQVVVGKYNVRRTDGGGSSYEEGNTTFIVGVGTESARANGLRVSNTSVSGNTYSTSGADYAEMFEWEDGNLNKEDRRGKFVTLNGDKIRIANPSDDYILGVVSANPSVIGDDPEDQHYSIYERDVFGNIIYEEVIHETKEYDRETVKTDSSGEKIKTYQKVVRPGSSGFAPKINPNYDPSLKYVPRSERSEWQAIGLLGKLIMIDDGTSIVNKYVKCGENGVATASTKKTKYRVMKRIDENHIQIMIL